MKSKFLTVIAALALLTSSTLAQADTITFESTKVIHGQEVTSGGFVFEGPVYDSSSVGCYPACPNNGTHYLMSIGFDDIGMKKSGGGAFTLLGFDVAGTLNFNLSGSPENIPPWVKVTGTLVGGGTVSQSFAIDRTTGSNGTLNFTSYTFLPTFQNLLSVSFTVNNESKNYWGMSLDNISVAVVPEPETYAMLLGGLGLLGAIARRRKQA